MSVPGRTRTSLSTSSAGGRAAASAAVSASASAAAASVPPAAAAEAEEGEVFDIEDFTCASPFERFVAVVEEQLRAWNLGILPHAHDASGHATASPPALPPAATSTPGLPLQQALLSLSGRYFQLSLYHSTPPPSLAAASTSASHRRPSHPGPSIAASSALLSLPLRMDHVSATSRQLHPISVWFGVGSFLLLQPALGPGEQRGAPAGAVVAQTSMRRVSKNEASMLLSAVSLACNNAGCVLAAFVSVDDGSKHLYWGRTCYGSVVRFDSRVSTEELPPSLRKLSGLTEHFNGGRDRLEGRPPGQVQVGPARTLISASLAYMQQTRKWGYHDIGALRSGSADDGEDDGPTFYDDADGCRWRDVSEDAYIGFGAAWGPREDPLTGLLLVASWPFFPEGTFVDNEVYTDLDGLSAPHWQLSVSWRVDPDAHARYSSFTPLASALQCMVDVCQAGQKVASIASVLGNNVAETPESLAQGAQAQAALSALVQETGVVQPLNALRAVQSSLKAHIEDAKIVATHGHSVPMEHIDAVMRELLDIEHAALSPPPPPGSMPRTRSGGKPVSGGASPSSAVPGSAFPFIPETPIDPFSTTPYPASPADPPAHMQLLPYGSLLSRFVFALLATFDSGQLTLRTVASMWHELVQELRFHFETGLPIPRLLSDDVPDFNQCIIQQKLQMLQRCIRIKREQGERKGGKEKEQQVPGTPERMPAAGSSSKGTPNWKQPWTAWSEEKLASSSAGASSGASSAAPAPDSWGSLDDLGVDAGDAPAPADGASGWGELDLSVHDADSDDEESALDDAAARSPRGVASVSPDVTLLLTGAPLRLPLTQEARVMTQDQFDEQSEMFARLGTGSEAQRLRTEMQTAGLLSDMQAFKAANPGCILEDFVRWHSPKDWRPVPLDAANPNAKRGELTQRMRKRPRASSGAEGGPAAGAVNIWHSLWRSATPVPASEQTPLFDPLTEGEHVLNWLEHIDPPLLFAQLLGVALQNSIGLLARTRGVAEQLQPVTARVQKLHHYLKNYNRGNVPQDLHVDFSSCELLCARATSLLLCIPPSASTTAAAPAPTSTSSKPAPADATQPTPQLQQTGRDMIAQLLHTGAYHVSSSGPERAALTALLSCTSPRSKPISLFRSAPYSYQPAARGGQVGVAAGGNGAMEAAGTTVSLPNPDWSELTFFAPHAPTPHSGGAAAGAAVGSRTYVCQRHSPPHGDNGPQFKVRICTATLLQAP